MLGKKEFHGEDYMIVNTKKESVWDYVRKIKADDGTVLGYRVFLNICYYSKRYRKWIGVESGDKSDGATMAKDVDSFAWIFHDELKLDKAFEDGSECSNYQASHVCSDLLKDSGHWFRAKSWFAATLLWGTVVK
jgi:hypothetical protein